VDVANLLATSNSSVLFSKVDAALTFIAVHDPHRGDRISRDIKRIVFLESGPEFWPGADACVLHDITRLSIEQVALIIVHEATHARLWHAGIRYNSGNQGRVERLCVSAELAFLARIPNSGHLRITTERKLNQAWWTKEARFERHRDELVAVGAPTWMQRLHAKMFQPSSGTTRMDNDKR
jgi:hypothetical protein